jgi:hypothetical protein
MSKQNLAHGEGNRVASMLFDPADDSHVSKTTPL